MIFAPLLLRGKINRMGWEHLHSSPAWTMKGCETMKSLRILSSRKKAHKHKKEEEGSSFVPYVPFCG